MMDEEEHMVAATEDESLDRLIAWHQQQVDLLRPFRRSSNHLEAAMRHAQTVRHLRALQNKVKDYDANFPCDGGCNYNDGPEETCSRHGRGPRDLWDLLDADRGRISAACVALAWLPDHDGHDPERVQEDYMRRAQAADTALAILTGATTWKGHGGVF